MTKQTNLEINVTIENDESLQQVTFKIEDFVGSGQLGAVYGGRAITAEGTEHDIVVKVPHSKDKFKEATTEYNILSGIANTIPESIALPVPHVWLGRVDDKELVDVVGSDEQERPVVVMPYYNDEQLLTLKVREHLDKHELIPAEILAIDAMIAFSYAMEALHENGSTCTDRKIKDFYLTDDGIVIIDWNVLRADAMPLRVAEIGLVGYLWHELYFGSKGQVPYMPFKDELWRASRHIHDSLLSRGLLSVGFRLLMARAVSFNADTHGKPSFAGLRQLLETWKQLLRSSKTPTIADVQNAFSTFPEQGNELADVQAQSLLEDLKWRLEPSSDVSVRDSALKEAHSDYLGAGEDGEREEIIQAFRIDPAGAHELVNERLEKAVNAQNWHAYAHLTRWQKILELVSLSADTDISRREREDTENWLQAVGEILHVNPIGEDESVAKLNEALALLEKVEGLLPEKKETELIRDEIRIRLNAEKYRGAYSLRQRKQILADARLDLHSLEGHYLDGGEYELSENTPTLLQLLLSQKLIRDLGERLEQIWENSKQGNHEAPQSIYELYQTTLAMAQLDDERQWVKNTIRGDLEIAQLLQTFNTPQVSLIQPAISQIERIQASGYDLSGNADNILNSLLLGYIKLATDELTNAMNAGWKDVFRVEPLYHLLKEENKKKLATSNENTVKTFGNRLNFYKEWFKYVTHFVDSKGTDKRAIEKLIRLIARHKGGTMNTEELLGIKELENHRKTLEEAIENKLGRTIGDLQKGVSELVNQLGDTEIELTTIMQSVMTSLDAKKSQINNQKQSLTEQINTLKKPFADIELYQLLLDFNLDGLQRAIKDNSVDVPQEVKTGLRDLSKLSTELSIDRALSKAMPTLAGYDVLERLKNLSAMLTQNQLPDAKFPLAGQFFRNPDVIRMEKENLILRRIVNKYWILKAYDLKDADLEAVGESISAVYEANDKVEKLELALRDAEIKIHNGDYTGAWQQLKSAQDYNATVRDRASLQSIQNLKARMQSQKDFINNINSILSSIKGIQLLDNKPIYANKYANEVARYFEELTEELKQCPADIFSPFLMKQWTEHIDKALADFQTKMRDVRGLSKTILQFQDYVKDNKGYAGEKQEEYFNIYPAYKGVSE